jgi:hypothetical protein
MDATNSEAMLDVVYAKFQALAQDSTSELSRLLNDIFTHAPAEEAISITFSNINS